MVFEVVKHDGRGRQVRHQLDNLPLLADGVMAHTLSGDDLYRRLAKLKVPGITVHTGKQDLLVSYSSYLRETRPEDVVNGILNVTLPPKDGAA